MRKITIKLYITIILTIFSGILNAEDGSKGSPFTNIGHAHFVPEPGTYHFNIGGNTFSSHVDKDGWVLVAAANKGTRGAGNYREVNAITLNSDQVLSKDIRTGIAGITELRIHATQGPASPFDVTTGSKAIIDNFYSNKTLSKGDPDKGSKWTGTNAALRMKFVCPPLEAALNANIYHACGNAQGLHWIPKLGQERINFSPSSNINDLNLWARGEPVEPPSSSVFLMSVFIVLGLAFIGTAVFMFIKQKEK